MKTINPKILEVESVAAIEKDLAAARRVGRFEDVLFHLGELVAVHMHTESEPLRLRCAQLLAA